jgi:integrase
MYERERIIKETLSKYPSIQVPDLLLIHDNHGKLTGYGETAIDKAVIRFRTRMESLYGRKFDFSNHTLRRTFGRRQWKLGTPIETISEMLGHESIDMTKKYLGLCLDDQVGPMQRQDDWIKGIVKCPEKGTFGVSQQEWWAQRDLDS